MKAIVTQWPSLLETDGQLVETTWDRLFEKFSRVQVFRGDREHPGWSGARFDPPRRGLEHVREVTALVLDYDGAETFEAARELWLGFYGLMHTTRKHTDEAHRFRVILPLSRAVSPAEYARIWARVNELAGAKLDPAPKDPSRFWFTPGVMPNGSFRAVKLDGQPLDADKFLAMPEPMQSEPAEVIPIHASRNESQYDRERRAVNYIERMPAAYSGQQGHLACWAVARKLAQDFQFDEATTFRILWQHYNPRCRPPWTEKELRHKARSAVEKARVSNPIADTHWELPREHYAEPVRNDDGEVGEPMPEDPEQTEKVPAAKRFGARSVLELFEAVVVRAQTQRPERGITTGNFELDDMLGGFRRQRITILGAETSFGKSSFAIMVADEAMRAGAGVLLVSGEDSPDTYGQRLMARRARINAFQLRDNVVLEDDLKRMTYEMSKAEIEPFFIDGIGKTAEHLSHAVRALCAEHDIGLVIVDYLQAFNTAKRCQDRRTEVTHIARSFADAIKNSNAAGLLLSQLRRPENTNREPSMHDLKESGDLENMAEHVLLGQIETNQNGDEKRWFLIGKNKDGPRNVARIEMPFDIKTASFKTVRGETMRQQYDQFDGQFDDGEAQP